MRSVLYISILLFLVAIVQAKRAKCTSARYENNDFKLDDDLAEALYKLRVFTGCYISRLRKFNIPINSHLEKLHKICPSGKNCGTNSSIQSSAGFKFMCKTSENANLTKPEMQPVGKALTILNNRLQEFYLSGYKLISTIITAAKNNRLDLLRVQNIVSDIQDGSQKLTVIFKGLIGGSDLPTDFLKNIFSIVHNYLMEILDLLITALQHGAWTQTTTTPYYIPNSTEILPDDGTTIL